MRIHHLGILLLTLAGAAGGNPGPVPGGNLREMTVEDILPGPAILRRDFEHCQPPDAVIPVMEDEKPPTPLRDVWILRHPAWTPTLLNAVGHPPDLEYDPHLTVPCDIYLGIRAVDPRMSFEIKLTSDPDFTVVTAPAATPDRHYDTEFFWRARVPLAGERIILRPRGDKFYLQYFKFIPWVTHRRAKRVPVRWVTICREPGRHFAFPAVAELPNGDLAVVCREGIAHVCPFGRIVLIRSRDGGRTWGDREVIYDSPSDDRDPSIHVLPDGRVLVSLNTWHSWLVSPGLQKKYAEQTARLQRDGLQKYAGSWLIVSKDNGHTWNQPMRAPLFSPHGPVIGNDGALYYIGLQTELGKVHVRIYRAADPAGPWKRYAEVGYSPQITRRFEQVVFDEPNLCQLPDGRWVATLRVEVDGYARQAYSSDGVQWSFPKKVPVRGYPQHLCPLHDGRLLLTYGYRFPPRGIRGCLSDDGGHTYDLDHEIVFRSHGVTNDLGYPFSIELKDGRVLTVYYYNDKGHDCHIEGVFYRP